MATPVSPSPIVSSCEEQHTLQEATNKVNNTITTMSLSDLSTIPTPTSSLSTISSASLSTDKDTQHSSGMATQSTLNHCSSAAGAHDSDSDTLPDPLNQELILTDEEHDAGSDNMDVTMVHNPSANLPIRRKVTTSTTTKMPLLEFEIEMLKEATGDDCLLITAPGLGLYRHVIALMKHYLEHKNFVVITGTDAEEEKTLVNMFSQYTDLPADRMPVIVNSDTTQSDRRKIYSKGGVVFITGRILVVDLLNNRIEINDICGLLVFNAHRISDNSQNAFICRLFRMHNRTGFIKAFSSYPEAFGKSRVKLEQAMRLMFIRKLSLWPRFHASVKDSLDKRAKPDTQEIQLPLTEPMKEIQFSIMKLLQMLLTDIAKSNRSILCDFEQMSVENIISSNLSEYFSRQFYPVWHQLDARTKKNLHDLRQLRRLLFSLTSDDCITFYRIIDSIKRSIKVDTNISDWVHFNPADALFVATEKRICRLQEPNSKRRNVVQHSKPAKLSRPDPSTCLSEEELFDNLDNIEEDGAEAAKDSTIIEFNLPEQERAGDEDFPSKVQLETNLKWKSLCDIIDEIKQGLTVETEVSIFVLVENDRTIVKLREVLERSPEVTLQEMYNKCLVTLRKIAREQGDEELGVSVDMELENVTQSQSEAGEIVIGLMPQVYSLLDKRTQQYREVAINIHFHCYREDQIIFEQKLLNFKPMHIICYDYSVPCIRMIEMYQAVTCAPERCKVYLLVYNGSAEEQCYFTKLRKEKESFEQLIAFKSTMVIPTDRSAGMDQMNIDLVRGKPTPEILTNKAIWDAAHRDQKEPGYLCNLCSQYFEISEKHRPNAPAVEQPEDDSSKSSSTKTNSTTIGARCCIACNRITRKEVLRQRIIVDMREFRCPLPAVIHKRGIDLIPAQIEIGDYILTPEICVERKSISDLTQSLQSGRLFQQCKVMCRHYRRSILLIEFDENRSFSFKGMYWRTDPSRIDTSWNETTLIGKLVLLNIHFPQMRFIWSPSPQFSGETFEHIKEGREQPDLEQTLRIRENQLKPEVHEDHYDLEVQDFLIRLPGVNVDNVFRLMNSIEKLKDLFSMSRDKLIEVLASEQNGSRLFQVLHEKTMPYCVNDILKLNNKSNNRRIFTKINAKKGSKSK